MVLDGAAITRPHPRHDSLRLQRATAEDAGVLASVIAASFGDPEDEVRKHVAQRLLDEARERYATRADAAGIAAIDQRLIELAK